MIATTSMYLAPIYVYPVLAILFPVVLYFVKRKYIWLSLILVVAVELIMYWDNFSYYEARPLMIALTLAQLVVMAILILMLKKLTKNEK